MLRLWHDERRVAAAVAAEAAARVGAGGVQADVDVGAAGAAGPGGCDDDGDGWRGGQPLGQALDARQQEELAHALGMNAVAVRWCRGDVLLLDNARVLHDGLPGYGTRSLKVALLGECATPQSLTTLWPGIFDMGSHRARVAPALELPNGAA
eukprot:5859288-Prymnesium_polylepis.1